MNAPCQTCAAALAELEKTVAAQINAVADANAAAQIRARLALYQDAVPFAMKLVRLQAEYRYEKMKFIK